jgi:DNA ligase 4
MFEHRDEGIVLKDLDSKWEPSDRSGKWLKLKPEYVRPGSDLDVLIIGLLNFSASLKMFHCLGI